MYDAKKSYLGNVVLVITPSVTDSSYENEELNSGGPRYELQPFVPGFTTSSPLTFFITAQLLSTINVSMGKILRTRPRARSLVS